MLSMLTKIISLKDYRRKITKLWKEAQENGVRYIVLHHSKPILDVRPYQEDEIIFGDDLTDEDVFKILKKPDLGVRIGLNRSSQAKYYLSTPKQLSQYLRYISKLS